MSNALTSKGRVKDRLKINTTDFDTLITNLILSVTAKMETMCNRDFTAATYTNEQHDGSDLYGSLRNILIPRNARISNVATIEYKAGTNTTPNWTAFTIDDFDVDETTGLIYFNSALPRGYRNTRITYTAGWDGYEISTSSLWNFNVVPTGTVNGSNTTFTLPEAADEVLVYADGVRIVSTDVTFTAGGTSVVLAAGAVPYSTIAVDYKATPADSGDDPTLPAELVDVCERAVIHLFKKRDSEGRSSESFSESSITWNAAIFDAEMVSTIRNYRRGYDL